MFSGRYLQIGFEMGTPTQMSCVPIIAAPNVLSHTHGVLFFALAFQASWMAQGKE
jgi:hypothetical protein